MRTLEQSIKIQRKKSGSSRDARFSSIAPQPGRHTSRKNIKQNSGIDLTRFHDNAVIPLKRKMPISKLIFTLCVLCSLAVSIVWIQIQIDDLSTSLNSLSQKRNNLQSMIQYKQLQIDNAISYDELFGVVNPQFGMDLRTSQPVLIEVPNNILVENFK